MKKEFLWFISNEEEKRILEAIARAEKNTSGEIRVHLHANGKGDVMDRAKETFFKIGMDRTKLRNGVLIYIDTDRRKFAVIGDEGIHRKVGDEFWQKTAEILSNNFRKKAYAQGLIEAIDYTGRALKRHFPYQQDDVNELPDDISTD